MSSEFPGYSEQQIEELVDRLAGKIGHDETCSYGMKATTLEILEHFVTGLPYCEYFPDPRENESD